MGDCTFHAPSQKRRKRKFEVFFFQIQFCVSFVLISFVRFLIALDRNFLSLHLLPFSLPCKDIYYQSILIHKLIIQYFLFADVGRIGIGICYDIRFQELAALYAARGASFLNIYFHYSILGCPRLRVQFFFGDINNVPNLTNK